MRKPGGGGVRDRVSKLHEDYGGPSDLEKIYGYSRNCLEPPAQNVP
jgi:hypothetical protein